MTISINSSAEHRRELDKVSDQEIDEALARTLHATASRLSATFEHAADSPEQEAAYHDALLRFGIAAAAKYEYKRPEGSVKYLTPNWIRGARVELTEQVHRNPHQHNLLETPFFSRELSVTENLNRAVHAFVQETASTPSLNERQFAAEIALHAAVVAPSA